MLRFEEPAPEVDMPAQIDAFWASGWGVILTNVITVVAIVVIALVIRWLLHFAIRRTVNRIVSGVKRKQDVEDTQALNASPLAAVRLVQRTRTLGSVLTNFVNITLFIVVVLAVVQVLVPDILGSFTLLSAAIGAGLGFGAQNIVKDALNGFFMVIEDQLGVGDIVDLGHATGIVEDVRIRVTSVRDVNGTLWFVRNGEINRVGNMSQGWARVIVDLAVPYEADVEEVEAALLKAATGMAQSGKWRSRILEKPEVWGLESISADAMVIRVVMKARTSSKDDVARELRMRLKRALDDLGLKLPSLSSVILTGFDGVTRVKGAKPPKTAPSPVVPATDRRGLRTKRAVDSITGAGSVPPTDAAPGASPEPPAGPQTPPKDAP
ncbi:mechanosensitive ion channel family protein [Agromyces sp. NDB4Y10]|uniref:mechanosensitive ion channel family protein n=1 Tax=unclassified Agromyces TaxID=2639701 RepID=UPI0007B28FD5|nr:putative MscS family protein YkuT [Agromyces sp. NDB4Y10]